MNVCMYVRLNDIWDEKVASLEVKLARRSDIVNLN